MTCTETRRGLSAYRDGELAAGEGRALALHLDACGACADHERQWSAGLDALAGMSRLHPEETIASAVFDRLDFESRSPGLSLLFRPALAGRPLMLPSLLPACLVLFSVLGLALAGDAPAPVVVRAPAPSVRAEAWASSLPASGTEGNPLPPTADVSVPRVERGAVFSDQVLASMGDAPIFLETVVARDGSVSEVNLLGDGRGSALLVEALRQERFSPGRLHGRPVAVSVYRLISRTDVRPPVT